jgi:hypothetical protein
MKQLSQQPAPGQHISSLQQSEPPTEHCWSSSSEYMPPPDGTGMLQQPPFTHTSPFSASQTDPSPLGWHWPASQLMQAPQSRRLVTHEPFTHRPGLQKSLLQEPPSFSGSVTHPRAGSQKVRLHGSNRLSTHPGKGIPPWQTPDPLHVDRIVHLSISHGKIGGAKPQFPAPSQVLHWPHTVNCGELTHSPSALHCWQVGHSSQVTLLPQPSSAIWPQTMPWFAQVLVGVHSQVPPAGLLQTSGAVHAPQGSSTPQLLTKVPQVNPSEAQLSVGVHWQKPPSRLLQTNGSVHEPQFSLSPQSFVNVPQSKPRVAQEVVGIQTATVVVVDGSTVVVVAGWEVVVAGSAVVVAAGVVVVGTVVVVDGSAVVVVGTAVVVVGHSPQSWTSSQSSMNEPHAMPSDWHVCIDVQPHCPVVPPPPQVSGASQLPQSWITRQSSVKGPQATSSDSHESEAVHPHSLGTPPPPHVSGGVHSRSVQQPSRAMHDPSQQSWLASSQQFSPQTVVPAGQQRPLAVQTPLQQPSTSQQSVSPAGQHPP